MTSQQVLETLLARLGAAPDGVAFVGAEELVTWPKSAVSVLKEAGLLSAASPAASVVCNGCELGCTMSIEIVDYPAGAAAFVHCDKRDDISRVDVPLSRLERWQASGEAVAAFLADRLGLSRSAGGEVQAGRWEVGVLRGERAAHVVLIADNVLKLELAGHSVFLSDVLSLERKALALSVGELVERVDNPLAGGGSRESAALRAKRIAELAGKIGVKATANKEGISPSRVKQLSATYRKKLAAGKIP